MAEGETIEEQIRVVLDWQALEGSLGDLPEEPGLYAVTGRSYGAQGVRLLYLGMANSSLRSRWTEAKHVDWFERTSRLLFGMLFFATYDGPHLAAIEGTLIYVHQPPQNSSKLNKLPRESLLIHNTGTVPVGMLPAVDSEYPWFGLSR